MKFVSSKSNYENLSNELTQKSFTLETEIKESIESVTEDRLARYFNDFGLGEKSISLTRTFRDLILKELEIRHWEIGWDINTLSKSLPGSLHSFRGAKAIEGSRAFATVDVSFDNVMRLGTNLLKPEPGSHRFSSSNKKSIAVHFLVVPLAELKDGAGIDGTAATYEEYLLAVDHFSDVLTVPLCIIGLEKLLKFEVTKVGGSGTNKQIKLAPKS